MATIDEVRINDAAGASAESFDVQRVRSDFPALGLEVHGKPLVYLDNAATTQKPETVLQAEDLWYRESCANVHRGVHFLSQKATDAYEAARTKVQRFINAEFADEIVFVRGTTDAINLVASSFGEKQIGAGDEVLITEMEHHSNIVPWQLLCEREDAVLRVAPINDRGEIIMEEFESLLSDRTRIVAAGYVSNALGTINPVRQIVEQAHGRGVPVLFDGAQAMPHLKVDVQKLGCDFLRFLGSQDVWADRDWWPLRTSRSSPVDAALPGWWRDDTHGLVCGIRICTASGQIRGRDSKHCRGSGTWSGGRLSIQCRNGGYRRL